MKPFDAMAFRWKKLGWWVILAIGLALLGLLLMGLPGVFVYRVWQELLNGIFQREVIAKLEGLGAGALVVGICLSFLTPLGLPIGYILESLLNVSLLQGHPLLRDRNNILIIFTMLWSLILVFIFSEMAWDAKKSLASY